MVKHADQAALFGLRLPPKQVINNTNKSFVEKRKRDLENYLQVPLFSGYEFLLILVFDERTY